jgi:hypothetical protein
MVVPFASAVDGDTDDGYIGEVEINDAKNRYIITPSGTGQTLKGYKVEFKNQTGQVTSEDNGPGKGNTVTFSSNWETVKKDGLYGIPAQQNVTPLESVLIRTQADKAFLPTRCGFSWDEQASSASELCIVHATQAELTAIKNVSVQNTSGNAYDLSGRKVTTAKGLRIQDGKKVLK